MLTRDGYPTPLGQALAEYGRIPKTLHLPAMVDTVDETYRRTVTRQLNIGESRHSLARKIFHGHRGDIMQPYRAGQEDQLGALGLVLNAVVLWNSRYIDLAVNVLRGQGYPVRDEDAARLSPLGYAHINMLDRYSFPAPSAEQRIRPLHDPDAPDGLARLGSWPSPPNPESCRAALVSGRYVAVRRRGPGRRRWTGCRSGWN
jgi:hypothetical protein